MVVPLHDTVFKKRYRVAAGSARPLRDYLPPPPPHDFSIIRDYCLDMDVPSDDEATIATT